MPSGVTTGETVAAPALLLVVVIVAPLDVTTPGCAVLDETVVVLTIGAGLVASPFPGGEFKGAP